MTCWALPQVITLPIGQASVTKFLKRVLVDPGLEFGPHARQSDALPSELSTILAEVQIISIFGNALILLTLKGLKRSPRTSEIKSDFGIQLGDLNYLC